MERLEWYEGRVKTHEGGKEALEKTLVTANSATKDALNQVRKYIVKVESLNTEIERLKSEPKKAKAEFSKRALTIESLKKTLAKLEKKGAEDADASYNEGFRVATDQYKNEVILVRDLIWSKSWTAALKEVIGVPIEHPAFQKTSFPSTFQGALASAPTPTSSSVPPTSSVPTILSSSPSTAAAATNASTTIIFNPTV